MKVGEPLYENGPIYDGGGLGYYFVYTDTDGAGLVHKEKNYTVEDLNAFFFEFFDKILKQWGCDLVEIEHYHPITGEKHIKNHWIVFEHEDTYHKGIWFRKKRYAKLTEHDGEYELGITGLDCLNPKTNRLAAKLQEEMLEDILRERFDLDQWYNKLSQIKDKVFRGDLEPEYLKMVKTIRKDPKQYEGYVIDKNTGQPKVKKDGTLQEKSVPGYVELHRKMLKEGKEVYIGQKLPYYVITEKPKQKVDHIDNYVKGSQYSAQYYWKAIISPLIRTLYVYDSTIFNCDDEKKFKKENKWGQLFNMTYKELSKIASMEKDVDDSEN
ncbi:MAG: DNA polymerase domain-containing protein [archaeon]